MARRVKVQVQTIRHRTFWPTRQEAHRHTRLGRKNAEGRPLAERIGPRADSADAATNCGSPGSSKAHLMLVIRSWREYSALP